MNENSELASLVQTEPFFQQCWRIIESTILDRGVDFIIAGKEPTAAFHKHVTRYYVHFLRVALKQIYFCGFVLWRPRLLEKNDVVPEAIPLGCFDWSIRAPKTSKRATVLEYYITKCFGNVQDHDVHLIPVEQPMYLTRSGVNGSPLFKVLQAYRSFQQALQNSMDADEWNSMAHLAYKHASKQAAGNVATQIDWNVYNDAIAYETSKPSSDFQRYQRLMSAVEEQGLDMSKAEVLPLSDDCELTQLNRLEPINNAAELYGAYQVAVCNVLGVPTLLAMQGVGKQGAAENATVMQSGYSTSSRVFSNAMADLAKKLSYVLEDVYSCIYEEKAEFKISPMSRLEINSFETVCNLLESETALQPETRLLLQRDLHFQLTGRELKRYYLFTLCVFWLQAAHMDVRRKKMHGIVLTQDIFLSSAEESLQKNKTQPQVPNAVSQEKTDTEKNPTLTESPPKAQPSFISVQTVQRAARPAHLVVSALLLASLYDALSRVLFSVVLGAPCLWLLPVVLDVVACDGSGLVTLRVVCGLFYVILFPIWIMQSLQHTSPSSSNAALSITVSTLAFVFYTPLVANNKYSATTVFLLGAILLPVPVAFPETAQIASVFSTCCLAAVLTWTGIRTTYE